MSIAIAAFTVDITPTRPVELAGYRRRRGTFTHVATKLLAQGSVFFGDSTPIVLLSLDTLFSSEAFEAAVMAALDEPVRLLTIASHTHNAPALDATKPRLGRVDDDYFTKTVHTVATGIKDAIKRPIPLKQTQRACITVAGGVYRRQQVNTLQRRWPFFSPRIEMLPNHSIAIPQEAEIVIWCAASRPIAALWTWPCHPVTTPSLQAVHSDLPGLVRDGLRAHLNMPDLPILFAPGLCGDIRPDFTATGGVRGWLRFPHRANKTPRFRRPTQTDQRTLADRLIQRLTEALAKTQYSTPNYPLLLRHTQFNIPGVHSASAKGIKMQFAQLGGVPILAVGAEISTEHRSALAKIAPKDTLLTGCSGHVFGYLPTDAQLPQGGYEVDGHFPGFGLSGQPQPGIDAQLQTATRRVVNA